MIYHGSDVGIVSVRQVPLLTRWMRSSSEVLIGLQLLGEIPRQQFSDSLDQMLGDVREHVSEIGFRNKQPRAKSAGY